MSVSLKQIFGSFFSWWMPRVRLLSKGISSKPAADSTNSSRLTINETGYVLSIPQSGVEVEPFFVNSMDELSTQLKSSNKRALQKLSIHISENRNLFKQISDQLVPEYRIRELAELDVVASTPFDPQSTYVFVGNRSGSAKGYFIVKHSVLTPVLNILKNTKAKITSVVLMKNGEEYFLSPLDLKHAGIKQHNRNLIGKSMTAVLIAVSVFTIGHFYWRNYQASNELAKETSIAREQVKEVRTILAGRNALKEKLHAVLDLKKATVPTIEVWEELSRLLTDTTWLASLRIQGDEIFMSGYSKEAAFLIPVIEASPIFMEPSFDGPVVSIAGKNQQRFAIKARLEK